MQTVRLQIKLWPLFHSRRPQVNNLSTELFCRNCVNFKSTMHALSLVGHMHFSKSFFSYPWIHWNEQNFTSTTVFIYVYMWCCVHLDKILENWVLQVNKSVRLDQKSEKSLFLDSWKESQCIQRQKQPKMLGRNPRYPRFAKILAKQTRCWALVDMVWQDIPNYLFWDMKNKLANNQVRNKDKPRHI